MTIKRWHCSGNEKNKPKQQSTVNKQNSKDDLKILLKILSSLVKTFRPLSIFVTRQHMSGQHLTQSEFTLQQVVELFGNLLIQLEEAHLTHTYRTVFRFCQLGNPDYQVLRYLNTRLRPFEEWAEVWLHDREV